MAENNKDFEPVEPEITNSIVPEEVERLEDIYSEDETLTNKIWINGKKVYRRVLDFGSLPPGTTKGVATGIVRYDEMITLQPIYTPSSKTDVQQGNRAYNGSDFIWRYRNDTQQVECTANYDASASSAYVILEYTRTDR